MDYFNCIKDKYNFVHSIDNCILTYYLKCSYKFALSHLQMMGCNNKGYWEKLNCSACVKYSFFHDHIHYDEGIYLKLGKYPTKNETGKMDMKSEWLNVIQVEVNPNKHFKKESFKEILQFIYDYCSEGVLNKYDYAIDMPMLMDSIELFDTRKEKGLYKGTRYYGQRNKNGYCKIYNKGVEQNSSDIITRVEHTCVSNNKLSLETLYYLDSSVSADVSALSSSSGALCKAIFRLKENNIEYSDILDDLPKSTRWRLSKALNGSYTKYEYDMNILNDLLKFIRDKFHVDRYVDADGFMQVSDEPLPWED